MSECKHIARPYAKAVFELAKEDKQLSEWSDLLENLSVISEDSYMADIVLSPSVSNEELSEIVIGILDDNLSQDKKNYIRVLAQYSRFLVSSEIYKLFDKMKQTEENTTEVVIESALEVSDEFTATIKRKLEVKFNGSIDIKVTKNPALIGGAIIRAGNLIIDGSVKNKIERLTQNLLA